MKFLRLLIAASTMSAVSLVSQVQLSHAQYYPQYNTGIQVQNLSSISTATVSLSFYPSPGAAITFLDPAPIPAGSSKTYLLAAAPLNTLVPANFNGSATVSSDQPVAAVVNVVGGPNPTVTAQTFGRAAYASALQGNTTVLLPLLLKNFGTFGNTTWFRVQNIGSSPADIYVKYSDSTTNAALNVQPGDSAIFSQANETHNAGIFAGTVTSTQPLAAAVIQEANPITGHLAYAYRGFINTSTNPVMPLYNKNANNGYITGIQIQNGGNTTTDVTVTYFSIVVSPTTAPATCTETQTINPGASATFGFFPAGTCPAYSVFIGSASVTGNSANQPLVAIVNQRQTGSGNGAGAYNGFDAATDGKPKVAFPLILDRFGGLQNYTGFNVQNVGTNTTTVTCTFTGSPTTTRTISATLAPGAALNDVHQFQFALGFIGSAICTGSYPTDKLVGVLNQVAKLAPGDRLYVSEGTGLD